MEVLLLQDVASVGKKNDLLIVGDGYALNYLLPRRFGIVVTPTVRRQYAELIRKRAEEREQEKQLKQGLATAIAGKAVHFGRKVTKTGKLYAAISEKAIAEALLSEHKIDVAPEAIQIAEPIKALGTFPVRVKMGDIEETVSVVVTAA